MYCLLDKGGYTFSKDTLSENSLDGIKSEN